MGDPPGLMSPIYPHITCGTGLNGYQWQDQSLEKDQSKTNLDLTYIKFDKTLVNYIF